MKILVIEDKAIHQQSARETLQGHDVKIVTSFDAAMKELEVTYDETRPLNEKVENPLPYEAVLTDMMMPMSRSTLSPESYKHGEQVPYGFAIALRAALRGAKFVAMVTDTNHHMGAMSAALDHLGDMYYQRSFKPNFSINGATCMFVHTPFTEGGSKDWGQVLKDLTA